MNVSPCRRTRAAAASAEDGRPPVSKNYVRMLKTLYTIGAYLGVALGAVHVLFTAVAYKGFSLGAFWFVGSGFAIIFAGFLNLILGRNAGMDRVSRALCHVANIICV